jgi:hypothetical protein
MAALAVCAVTAALARRRTSTLARPPASPGDLPPGDPGLIPLTAAEVKRLFNLVTRTWQTFRHYLGWSWWRRRHRPAPAGSTSEPACAVIQPVHDQGLRRHGKRPRAALRPRGWTARSHPHSATVTGNGGFGSAPPQGVMSILGRCRAPLCCSMSTASSIPTAP